MLASANQRVIDAAKEHNCQGFSNTELYLAVDALEKLDRQTRVYATLRKLADAAWDANLKDLSTQLHGLAAKM